ncbi:hypothetical protein HQ305_13485 [Rhodococcus sp. BP-149]|nr:MULTISPECIES: hypothetical protein [unclassified Rhodococcus (in: high G+C Gram-positive bacteria)]MBY6686570.1 hypothetical protein [Rhodococcus sp. BP-288]MBY6695280.1 hypothetical protein [Rhodococcus sp. BP-188]MBY6700062.1 hypothetical protein [Rhodococcus sp. BP-285]MBY6704915.1 hypothetical protein [Rhodococcus sp. BP-283]MBY6713187.1 hypothetical protein [Rhodococcus sp. BP-160]
MGQLDLYRAFTYDLSGVAALMLTDGLHAITGGFDVAARAAARMMGIAA